MRRMRTLVRRAWAGPLAALLFTTGLAGPLLESSPKGDGPVMESHHVAGECVLGHDHTLCTLINWGFALPAPTPGRHSTNASTRACSILGATTVRAPALPEAHLPRAPPFV